MSRLRGVTIASRKLSGRPESSDPVD